MHFECAQCGECCSGPGEGYIWVTRKEVELIAEFLNIPRGKFRREYTKRVHIRTTIIEQSVTKDCIFLRMIGGEKKCLIYNVRPNQCRIWPFWPSNLANPTAWNEVTQKCEGINRGRCYSYDDIQKIKKRKKWWQEKSKTK